MGEITESMIRAALAAYGLPSDLTSAGTGRAQHAMRKALEAATGVRADEKDLIEHWNNFCDCDPFEGSDTFAERMENAGYIEFVPVTSEALQSAFSAERGIEPGGMMYQLTQAGQVVMDNPSHPTSTEDEKP